MKLGSAAHASISLLFVTMAALQINDPDPSLWIGLYLAVAAIPAARVLERRAPVLFGTALGLVIACLLVSLPGFVDFLRSGDYGSIGGEMSSSKPYIESAREFLGALIGLICLIFYRKWHIRSAVS